MYIEHASLWIIFFARALPLNRRGQPHSHTIIFTVSLLYGKLNSRAIDIDHLANVGCRVLLLLSILSGQNFFCGIAHKCRLCPTTMSPLSHSFVRCPHSVEVIIYSQPQSAHIISGQWCVWGDCRHASAPWLLLLCAAVSDLSHQSNNRQTAANKRTTNNVWNALWPAQPKAVAINSLRFELSIGQ